MVKELAFVSCDIVGHSSERNLQYQIERIRGINKIVSQCLASQRPRSVFWASGGDGGHVAFAQADWVVAALRLISQFRAWSRLKNVPLRIVANCGEVDWIRGAGGLTQLVGPGINLAGRLLEYGDPERVVVTKEFAEIVESAGVKGIFLHDAKTVFLKYFPPQKVMLLSIDGNVQSKWDEMLDDRILLEEAIQDRRSWDIIYHSRRLLEVTAHDQDAIVALSTLPEQGLTYEDGASAKQRDNPLLGPMGKYPRVDFIRSSQLIERDKGEILCRSQDDGDTMFVILRGEVVVLSGTNPGATGTEEVSPVIRIGVGAIVGELAFALHRKRTATLQCSTRTALLSFSPQAVEQVSGSSPAGATIRRAMDRFVKLRILEHLCNNADYLIGTNHSGPLKDVKEPWALLVDNSTLIRYPSAKKRSISRQDKDLRGRGLYILVSGELKDISQPDHVLVGTSLPIVFADFPGEIQSTPQSYDIILDTIILRIAPEGFTNTFIPLKTFRNFLMTLRSIEHKPVNTLHSTAEQSLQHDGTKTGGENKVKILFLAANPLASQPLQLDRDIRAIAEKLRGTKEYYKIALLSGWALRADDLQQYLLEYRPHVVHFSGHGSKANELILEDKYGNPKALSQEALVSLFRALKDNIRVVVLNACFSDKQAKAITETIDCAIGMKKAIGDQAAITFAASLYRAFGFGRSVQTAFDLGKNSLLMEGISEETIPVLHAKAGVDLSAMVLVS